MKLDELTQRVQTSLEDMKAVDIKMIDVTGKSSMTDILFFATGNSTRHVKAIAEGVAIEEKEAGNMPLGVEGKDTAEWVLVDLNDVIGASGPKGSSVMILAVSGTSFITVGAQK